MESSILQHYWNQQEKERPLSLHSASARLNVPSANTKFDHIPNRSNIYSSQASFRTDFESNSKSILSPSSTNITIKEFCPVEKAKEEEEEEYSLKRRSGGYLCCNNCKAFTVAFIIGALLGTIVLAVLLTFYLKDRSSLKTTTTTTTSTTSTSSTATSSTTTTFSTSTTTSISTTSTTSTSSSTTTTSSTSSSTTTSTSSSTATETTTQNLCPHGNTIITFDDLTSSAAIPNGYNHMNWTNGNTHTAGTNTNGYYTGVVSSPYSLFNPYGNPTTMESVNSCPFTLNSLAIAAAWYDNLQLTVDGYSSGVVVVTNTFTIQVFTISTLTFSGYSGIDKIIFTASGGTKNAGVTGSGTQFAMDNIDLTFA